MNAPRAVARLAPVGPGVYRFRDESGKVLYIGRARNLRPARAVVLDEPRRSTAARADGAADRTGGRRLVRLRARGCLARAEPAGTLQTTLEPDGGRPRGRLLHPLRSQTPGPALHPHAHPDHAPFRPVPRRSPHPPGDLGDAPRTPLPYTSDTDGSTREFAELFGIGPADRENLEQTAIAVLERDADAVTALRTELVRRRDRAAADLRFEFAAKLQDEIAAFDWIVAEQKVSHLEPHDADIYGWSNGILVNFKMQAYRMSTWTLRATSAATARPRVASTPDHWQPFAHRNAQLAAHLLKD